MTTASPSPAPALQPPTPAAASGAAKPTKVAKATRAAKLAATPKAVATSAPAAKPVAPKTPAAKKAAAPKPAKAPAASAAKETKAKKPKLVRDSFTIPKDEYAVIEVLKERATALAQPVKKSELLRAGLKLLAGLSDTALRNALVSVPSIKTGRPKADATAPAPAAKNSAKPARK